MMMRMNMIIIDHRDDDNDNHDNHNDGDGDDDRDNGAFVSCCATQWSLQYTRHDICHMHHMKCMCKIICFFNSLCRFHFGVW